VISRESTAPPLSIVAVQALRRRAGGVESCAWRNPRDRHLGRVESVRSQRRNRPWASRRWVAAARQIVEAVAAHANLVAVIEWACLDTLAIDIEPGPTVGEYAMPVRRTEHERIPRDTVGSSRRISAVKPLPIRVPARVRGTTVNTLFSSSHR